MQTITTTNINNTITTTATDSATTTTATTSATGVGWRGDLHGARTQEIWASGIVFQIEVKGRVVGVFTSNQWGQIVQRYLLQDKDKDRDKRRETRGGRERLVIVRVRVVDD